MSPPAPATARRAPQRAPDQQPARQPLRVVPPGRRRRGTRRQGMAGVVSVVMLVGSLFLVVIGHAVLTQGQVNLATEGTQLSAEQVTHHRDMLQVATLETPARIVGVATGSPLDMVQPAQLEQLAYVSLSDPLPAPAVTPAPASATGSAPAPPGG